MEFPKDSKDILDTRQLQQDQCKEPKGSKEVKDIHRLLQDQQSQGKGKHLFAIRQAMGLLRRDMVVLVDMDRFHQDMEFPVLVQAMGDLLLDPNSAETLQRGLQRDRK